MINVKFVYKLIDNNKWKELHITPEEYFDLDKDEEIEIWSAPNKMELIDYIEKEKDKVILIKVTIKNDKNNEALIFKQTFWNNQNNSFYETIENNKTSELILSSLVNNNQEEMVTEIIRFSRKDGFFRPTLHSFIAENHVTGKLIYDKSLDIKNH